MKKLIGLMATTLCLAMSFTACSSDNGGDDPVPDTGDKTETGKLTALETNNLTALGIRHGSFSGITMMQDGHYTLVDDHTLNSGMFDLKLEFNTTNGKVTKATLTPFSTTKYASPTEDDYGSYEEWMDPEGIIYHPSTDTYFVAGERWSEILEFDREGNPTGRKLNVPSKFDGRKSGTIWEGFGFESLAYNRNTGLFWTATEKCLTPDRTKVGDSFDTWQNQFKIYITSFGEDLEPQKEYVYQTETFTKNAYVCGISDMLALDDGRLIVMEREVYVGDDISPVDWSSTTKLYLVDPRNQADGTTLTKTLLDSFVTKVNNAALADYEGICLGPKLKDGRQTILLLSDTQNGKSKSLGSITVTLQEYLKVYAIGEF